MIQENWVYLDEKEHRYYNGDGEEYTSNGKFCDSFTESFDSAGVAAMVAAKEGKTQEEVLQNWKDISREATEMGDLGHKNIENFLKTGKVMDTDFLEDAQFVHNIMMEYHKVGSEEVVYNNDLKLATTCDLIGKRTRSAKSIYDFGDIKYNGLKFSYDSSKVKHGKRKQYNKYYLYPIEHLEYSYYTKTCLQISFEMYLAELAGVKVGKGFIILLDWTREKDPLYLPVPYMKYEIDQMMKHWNGENAVF